MSAKLNEEGEPADPEVYAAGMIVYDALKNNWEIDFQEGYWDAGHAIVHSEWLRVKLRDAWDDGAARAGRYGHEDSWDDETNPHNDNPHRTEDEKEEY